MVVLASTILRCCSFRVNSVGLSFLQWTIQVSPGFHDGASNLEQLVPFEECIQLHSSEKLVARAPEYLLLTHNGRSFKLVCFVHILFFLTMCCTFLQTFHSGISD